MTGLENATRTVADLVAPSYRPPGAAPVQLGLAVRHRLRDLDPVEAAGERKRQLVRDQGTDRTQFESDYFDRVAGSRGGARR